MSTTSYNVYINATCTVETFDPNSTLTDVRTALTNKGLMKSTDSFLYKNLATKLKTVFGPISAENQAQLSAVLFPAVPSQLSNSYQLVQIVSTASDAPSLLGSTPPYNYFRPNGQMGVTVYLNDTDPLAIKNNKGMFEPVLLQNVESSNPAAPVTFTNCVIVQKGAIISLDITSWGAAGFGYVVTAASAIGGTDIAPPPPLVAGYTSNFGKTETRTLSRYVGDFQKPGDTIQIESNASLKIAKQYNVSYSTITVSTYSLSAWTTSDGTTYSSSKPIPSGAGATGTGGNEPTLLVADADWTPPPPAGRSDVPSGTTVSGSPKAGPPSTQKFGTIKSRTPATLPATRAGGLVGSVEIYFLVFDSKEDANTVIKVLNTGTMQV